MKKLLIFLVTLMASIGMAFGAVNVNTASQSELEALAGIGPVKAKAIVDYREKNGAFKSLDDLDKVPGIGKATLEKMRPDVTFSGANTGVSGAPAAKAPRVKATQPAPTAAPARPAATRAAPPAASPQALPEPKAVPRTSKKEATPKAKASTKSSGEVDVNSASAKELANLPGIGATRAKAIVKGRPYHGKDDLVARKILPRNVYDGIKDQIVARQK